jgi:hypothetical protein
LRKGFGKLACPWAFPTVLDAHLVRAEKIAIFYFAKIPYPLRQSRERNRAEHGRPLAAPRVHLGIH